MKDKKTKQKIDPEFATALRLLAKCIRERGYVSAVACAGTLTHKLAYALREQDKGDRALLGRAERVARDLLEAIGEDP